MAGKPSVLSQQANDLSIWYHIYWILDLFLFHLTSSHRSFSWKLLIAFHCHRSLYHPFHLNSSHVFIVVFPSSHLISSYIPLLCPCYITKKKGWFHTPCVYQYPRRPHCTCSNTPVHPMLVPCVSKNRVSPNLMVSNPISNSWILYNLCIYIYMYTWIPWNMHITLFVYKLLILQQMLGYIHVHMYIYIYAYVHLYIYTHILSLYLIPGSPTHSRWINHLDFSPRHSSEVLITAAEGSWYNQLVYLF